MLDTTEWQPAAHPVHKLIQLMDALLLAFDSFTSTARQITGFPAGADGYQGLPKEHGERFFALLADFNRVRDAVFGPRFTGVAKFARRLGDECVAYLAQQGRVEEELVIRQACETLVSYFSVRPDTWHEPWRPGGSNERYLTAMDHREQVFSTLSTLGEWHPTEVRDRLRLYHPDNGDPYPTHDQLLGWATCAHEGDAHCPRPPTPTLKAKQFTTATLASKPADGSGEAEAYILTGYAQIFAALNDASKPATWKNNPADQKRLRDTHERFPSPITFPGVQGAQPHADRGLLLHWYAGIKKKLNESDAIRKQQEESAMTGVGDTYQHGRDAVVAPEINGAVKRRRSASSAKV